MGAAAYGGRRFKERTRVSGERPIGAARCRQQYSPASCLPPPPPPRRAQEQPWVQSHDRVCLWLWPFHVRACGVADAECCCLRAARAPHGLLLLSPPLSSRRSARRQAAVSGDGWRAHHHCPMGDGVTSAGEPFGQASSLASSAVV